MASQPVPERAQIARIVRLGSGYGGMISAPSLRGVTMRVCQSSVRPVDSDRAGVVACLQRAPECGEMISRQGSSMAVVPADGAFGFGLDLGRRVIAPTTLSGTSRNTSPPRPWRARRVTISPAPAAEPIRNDPITCAASAARLFGARAMTAARSIRACTLKTLLRILRGSALDATTN